MFSRTQLAKDRLLRRAIRGGRHRRRYLETFGEFAHAAQNGRLVGHQRDRRADPPVPRPLRGCRRYIQDRDPGIDSFRQNERHFRGSIGIAGTGNRYEDIQ